MKSLKQILWFLAAGTFILAGCSGSGGGGAGSTADTDGGPATTSLAVKLASAASPTPAALKASEGEDEEEFETSDVADGTIAITEARVNLDRIDLKLPDELECSALAFTLEDGECSEEAEDDAEEGDDDAEDETDDLSALLNTEGDDDDSAEDEDEAGDDDAEDDEEGEDDDDGEEDDDHIRVEGPFVVDMLTGVSTPSLADIVVPSGTYREIALRVHDLDEDSTLVAADDPLLGNSMVVGGTYDDGTTVREFRISLHFNEEVRFRDDAGIPVNESDDVNELVVSLSVTDWFAGIDVGACLDSGRAEPDADGVLIVDEDTSGGECEFTDELKQNIKDSGDMEEEEDDDDDEDEDEDGEDEDEEGDEDAEDEEDEEE